MDLAQRALRRRGPDDAGALQERTANLHLVLGHTRLSIIDLSSGGHQPMRSGDGRFEIVFNGEIYNFRELRSTLAAAGHSFTTESDTEVLLAAWRQWGSGGLARLVGMFAFAVYDRAEETLTLVRDAFGIKPLFVALDRDALCFASEIPAILPLRDAPPDYDLQTVHDYLIWGRYDQGESTFFRGVQHLLPGHILRVDFKGAQGRMLTVRTTRWWWPSIHERRDICFREAAETMRALFLRSVQLHLVSDVPVGAALSGGLDSSAIVCAMRYLEPEMPINTFTFVADNIVLDEERWADMVNRHVAAKSHKVHIGADELLNDIEDLCLQQGEPFVSTSIFAQHCIYRRIREEGITVALDGQGGDELLAGYDGYPQAVLATLVDDRHFWGVIEYSLRWATRPGNGWPRALMNMIDTLSRQRAGVLARAAIRYRQVRGWLDLDFLRNHAAIGGSLNGGAQSPEGKHRRLAECLRFAQSSGPLQPLLRHADRSAMWFSRENRVPFLTTELAQFTLSLPESFFIGPRGETKWILRAAMEGVVPEAVRNREDKIGFAPPERAWIKQCAPELLARIEQGDSPTFINARQLNKDLRNAIARGVTSRLHWRAMNFLIWHARMADVLRGV